MISAGKLAILKLVKCFMGCLTIVGYPDKFLYASKQVLSKSLDKHVGMAHHWLSENWMLKVQIPNKHSQTAGTKLGYLKM